MKRRKTRVNQFTISSWETFLVQGKQCHGWKWNLQKLNLNSSERTRDWWDVAGDTHTHTHTHTHTYSQLPYPYWIVPLKTADTLVISMPMPSPGCSSNSLRPIDKLWTSKLVSREALHDLNHILRVDLCMCVSSVCVSSYLSRPYMTLPMKSRDFSPPILGYLACWNAASITLVVFSFTASSTQTQTYGQRCLKGNSANFTPCVSFQVLGRCGQRFLIISPTVL